MCFNFCSPKCLFLMWNYILCSMKNHCLIDMMFRVCIFIHWARSPVMKICKRLGRYKKSRCWRYSVSGRARGWRPGRLYDDIETQSLTTPAKTLLKMALESFTEAHKASRRQTEQQVPGMWSIRDQGPEWDGIVFHWKWFLGSRAIFVQVTIVNALVSVPILIFIAIAFDSKSQRCPQFIWENIFFQSSWIPLVVLCRLPKKRRRSVPEETEVVSRKMVNFFAAGEAKWRLQEADGVD